MISTLAVLLLVGALLVAAGFDLWRFEIPDGLSIAILVSAALYLATLPFDQVPSHLAAGGLVFAVGLFVFSRGWLGGGDVKLMAASASWATLSSLLPMLTAIAVAGGVLALLLIGLRFIAGRLGSAPDQLPLLLQPDGPVPYAVAIAAGIMLWLTRQGPVVGSIMP